MAQQSTSVQRYIAFLRAINVGGHTVKMEQLRKLFEALELSAVETFIASGNVIFEAPAEPGQMLEQAIERQLKKSLGYAVTTFIRSASELAAIAEHKPFADHQPGAQGNALYIGFLRSAPSSAARQKLMEFRNAVDDFQIEGREVYWLCHKKMSESGFSGALLEKTLGMPATLRNVTTVKKLAAKYPAPE